MANTSTDPTGYRQLRPPGRIEYRVQVDGEEASRFPRRARSERAHEGPLRGHIVGHYRATGPNAWDDFEYVEAEGDTIEVLAGLNVQAEPPLPRVRLRRRGQVHVVEWRPTPEDEAERKRSRLGSFAYFARRHLEDYSSPQACGLASLIYKKLKDDDRQGG